ncbi:helix-turn-helix domain-containing protein [Streptomyces sp. NPDC004520]|uniref:AraC-like ligand-binding domain-containing protein n=1 Tax=Streptomyces sp. NPDC004520 TaxID=3364702 RepID=UPI0036A5E460
MLSSKELPPRERFDWFSDLISREVIPSALDTECPHRFQAKAAVLELGDARVAKFEFSPLRSKRTPALIRHGDPEQYHLGLLHAGAASFSQHRNDCGVAAGDFVLWDTSRPSEAEIPVREGSVGILMLQLPRNALPLCGQHVDRLVASRIPGDHGMAAVLAAFLRSVASQGAQCTGRELDRLGSVAVDLLAATLAQGLDVEEQLPAEVRTQALVRRIHAFIDDHLRDPDLAPAAIAAAHNISVRTLHQLFQGTGETVQARVLRRRLERCRADLGTTALLARPHPVAVIAARWGFSGPAVFSRSFREAYGMSPTEFRALSIKEARAPRTLR